MLHLRWVTLYNFLLTFLIGLNILIYKFYLQMSGTDWIAALRHMSCSENYSAVLQCYLIY
jgi:hypothetical protein